MKQESIMSRLFRMISINSEPQENTETEENQQEENQPLEQAVPAAEPQSAEQAASSVQPENSSEAAPQTSEETQALTTEAAKPLLQTRSNGVLMHITSLPSRYGIGSFGKQARHFADLLEKSGAKAWQVLPFCPPDSVQSPYKSVSSFAGNPMFIDLEQLHDEGYLTQEELDSCRVDNGWGIDFERVIADRNRVFPLAFSRINDRTETEMLEFAAAHAWVDDYALFMALTEPYGYDWQTWPEALRSRDEKALEEAREQYAEQILYHAFLQYVFFKQWKSDKDYINSLGIKVIGDMPFYVSYESADVWANQEDFALGKDGKPEAVAGVPPDFFSKTGQLWGNPLYDWKHMAQTGYGWWMDRIGHALKIYDILRIDHFRAFASYYSIPAKDDTAMNGTWIKGPGIDFFNTLDKAFEKPEIIAEDLGGESAPEVKELIRATGIPGMRVMEMAFVSYGDNPHLPFNYIANSVAYLGTHDNNTLLGYLHEDLTEPQRVYALQYVNFDGKDDNWDEYGPNSGVTHAFLRTLWESSSNLVIVQLQDLMGYGSDSRMNLPASVGNNWSFRIAEDALNELNTDWLKFFNMTYQR